MEILNNKTSAMNLLCRILGHKFGPTVVIEEDGYTHRIAKCRRGCGINREGFKFAEPLEVEEAKLIELASNKKLKIKIDGKKLIVKK